MRTFSLKESQVKKDWLVVDAKGLILGRLAAIVASYLRGKHKPEFSPNMPNSLTIMPSSAILPASVLGGIR